MVKVKAGELPHSEKFVSPYKIQIFQDDWTIPEDNLVDGRSAIRPAQSIVLSNKFGENEDAMAEMDDNEA